MPVFKPRLVWPFINGSNYALLPLIPKAIFTILSSPKPRAHGPVTTGSPKRADQKRFDPSTCSTKAEMRYLGADAAFSTQSRANVFAAGFCATLSHYKTASNAPKMVI
jgi:phosphopantothenoylcysteine synthetase/decarboxylase